MTLLTVILTCLFVSVFSTTGYGADTGKGFDVKIGSVGTKIDKPGAPKPGTGIIVTIPPKPKPTTVKCTHNGKEVDC